MSTARRRTLGSLSTSSSSSALDRDEKSSRQSMGGKWAPVSKSNSRQSLAPSSSSSSLSSSSSRSSLAPSTSRSSLAPAQARNSLGNRNALVDRKSGGRRSSGAGAGASSSSRAGIRSDPRPLTSKEFVRDNIRKLIVYLTGHHYSFPLSPKQLISPSTRDFKQILSFLFQQVDANFDFTHPTLPPAFEDTVKTYMKRFGYPFAISKNALQAAGSPHTWPAILAMLVWMQEFLTYYEETHQSTNINADGSVSSTTSSLMSETDAHMFFEYASGAYLAFLGGEDNFSVFDSTLSKKFSIKNAVVTGEIASFEERNLNARDTIEQVQAAKQALSEYQQFVRAAKQDIPALEDNIQQNQQHKQLIETKKKTRENELASQGEKLALLHSEHASLSAALSAQPFTPTQVSELLHQRSTLEQALATQKTQAEEVTAAMHKVQNEESKSAEAMEKSIAEFNENEEEIQQLLAKMLITGNNNSAVTLPEFNHTPLQFDPTGDTLESMLVDFDFRTHKDNLTALKDSLVRMKKELTAEVKRQDSQIAAMQEQKAEREAACEGLNKRLVKLNDVYTSERVSMNSVLESSCCEVEDVELLIVRLKNSLSVVQSDQVVLQSNISNIDAEITRLESQHLAAESALKSEICAAMQELTEHKVSITEKLEQMMQQAEQIKQEIQHTHVNVQKRQQ